MKVQLAVLRWKLQRQDGGNDPGWVSLVQIIECFEWQRGLDLLCWVSARGGRVILIIEDRGQ